LNLHKKKNGLPGTPEKAVLKSKAMGFLLVPPVVADALFHLRDGVVDQGDRLLAMAALVGVGLVELGAGGAQVLEGGLHVRLIGARAADEEAGDEDYAKHKSGDDSGTRNSFHTIGSFHLANGGKSPPALPFTQM
jgi:hypothetical protein